MTHPLDVVDLGRVSTVVLDFYGTVVEDDVTVQPLWQELVALGYDGHPALEAMFEPDAFDGCETPRRGDDPSHEQWLRGNWGRMLTLAGVPTGLVEPLLTNLLAHQRGWRGRATPCSEELISLLRDHGCTIALCSNWENDIRPYLDHAGLPPFDVVVTSALVGARKPHSRIFAEVLERTGTEASACLFVGDNWEADVVGAVRAGMRAVWLRHRRSSHGMPRLVPEVDSIADLYEAMCSRLGVERGRTHGG